MKKYSLYTIVFAVFAILITTSFISIYFSSEQHRKDLIEAAIEEKTRLAEVVNEIFSAPFFSYREAHIPGTEKIFLAGIASFKEVQYIRIVKIDGTVYRSSIEKEEGEVLEEPAIVQTIQTKKTIIKDATYRGEKIKLIIYPGYEDKTIWVAFTLKSAEKAAQAIFIRDIAIAVGGLVLTLFIFIFILHNIINPIKKITLACEEIRKGNLNIKLDIKTKTEIGELAAVFNETIKNLKESREALEESKNVLEIKVQARTRELRDLAESLEGQVKDRTKELREKVGELERFNKLAVGRELKMVELKKEIEKLRKELGKSRT